jgi:hypothetical protein
MVSATQEAGTGTDSSTPEEEENEPTSELLWVSILTPSPFFLSPFLGKQNQHQKAQHSQQVHKAKSNQKKKKQRSGRK